MRDLERDRAVHALDRVTALMGKPNDFKKRYRSYVDRLGGAVVMNGLGQALATELAAADGDEGDPHHALAKNVECWLSRTGGVYPGSSDDVMRAITTEDQETYVRAQIETLAWLTWHKKFCHASFPKEGGD